MFLKKKKRVLGVINSVYELVEYIYKNSNYNLIDDLLFAVNSVLSEINSEVEKEEYNMAETIDYINQVIDQINKVKELGDKAGFQELNSIIEKMDIAEQAFLIQVKVKLNIVFMPYNITMWDSLESIYLAAKKDEDCVVNVVPIPFYDISQEKPVFHYHFDKYDKSINPIPYNEYSLAKEEPDIIYIHNIYDDGNTLTSVHPDYYTEKLKQYTDMLVYSPYCIPSFLNQYTGKEYHSYTFDLKGRNNIDRFICAGDFVYKEGLKSHIPTEKILNLGTPKFDSLINHINDDFEYSKEWIEKSEGKRVVLLSTSISYFIQRRDPNKNAITNFCDIICYFSKILQKYKDEDIFVIWRPHPLTRNFIGKIHPHFVEWYDNLCAKINGTGNLMTNVNEFSNVVLDENASFLPAFKLSDAFVLDYSSIMISYLLLNKKLIRLYNDKLFAKAINLKEYEKKIGFTIRNDVENMVEIVNFDKSGNLEIDSTLLSKFYKNLDGTAGQKIHDKVRKDTLKNN